MATNPLRIGFLCYPGLSQLDLTGPYELLSRMTDTETHVLWKDTAPVKTERGFCIVPDRRLREAPEMDVVVVPGGLGQQDLMEDDEVLSFLRAQAKTARYVVSVCTGSLLLAAAGLLRGYRATCHWMYLSLLEPLGAIPTRERVVIGQKPVAVDRHASAGGSSLMVARKGSSRTYNLSAQINLAVVAKSVLTTAPERTRDISIEAV